MRPRSLFLEYLEDRWEEDYGDDNDDKIKEEYVTQRKSILTAKRGRPFAFLEWFLENGYREYLDYLKKKVRIMVSLPISYDFHRLTLPWDELALPCIEDQLARIFHKSDEDEPYETAVTVRVPAYGFLEKDIHFLFEYKIGEAIQLLKSVDDQEFDKRAFYEQLQFHVNKLKALKLDNMKAVVKDEKVASTFERECNYFVAAILHHLHNVSTRYGFTKPPKRTETKSLIDPNHPLLEEELQFLYSYIFKLKHKTEEQRFISKDTPFDTFKSIINSPDLSQLGILEKPYIQFGCETTIAVETLMKLKDIIPNICKWKMIEKYEIFHTESGNVLRSSHASSVPSKLKKKSGSKASEEIAAMLIEIKR